MVLEVRVSYILDEWELSTDATTPKVWLIHNPETSRACDTMWHA